MLFACDNNQISGAVEFIRAELKKRKLRPAEISKAVLASEEIIRAMIAHAALPEENFQVRINAFMESVSVRITCRGTALDRSEVETLPDIDGDPESSAAIREILSRLLCGTLSLKYHGGINTAVVQAAKPRFKQLALTLGALLAGLLTGLLLNAVLPESTNTAINTNLFTPVATMFLNALKMVVGPLVLFSIASSIAEFNDIRALGRIAGKVLGGYTFTSIIAILVGTAVWFLIPIGDPALKNAVTDAGASITSAAQNTSVSLLDTIVGIIPQDVIQPFLSLNMLQIIFIAVVVGLAAGALANRLSVFRSFLADCSLVFSRITALIIGFMPAAIFCNMAKLTLTMKLGQLASALAWIPVIYLGELLMLVVYGLLIRLVGRENPLTFFRKFYPVMLTGYSLGSSNGTLPTSMEVCGKSLGISRRIYSFSLPLGATVNMDGSCVTLSISALFMAKIFGVQVDLPLLLTLFLSIFVLSVGAPGVPGATLICISILLPQIGIPADAISIVMGLYALVGMITACVNITGDAAITLIVAKQEKLLDLDVFRSKN